MAKNELLKDEIVEKILSPHPLSFMRLQTICIFLLVWGVVSWWLVTFSSYKDMFLSNSWFPIILWGLVLLLVGIIISLTTIRWSIFITYAAIFLGGLGLIIWQNWINSSGLFILIYTLSISVIGFLLVEWYRRSHKYIISNQRLVFMGGVLTKEERTLRYDKISDINAKQGILGQIFGFGTIIPVSQSGFGLGADKSFAGGVALLGGKKAKVGGFFGGGKDVQTPRSRSYFELHGIYPFKEVKKLVEELVQGTDITPYQKDQVKFQKEQVDIQKEMRDLLKAQNPQKKTRAVGASSKKIVDEEEDEEEEDKEQQPFKSEQIDIQKEMKELLKSQDQIKEQVNDQDEEENDNEEEPEGLEERRPKKH